MSNVWDWIQGAANTANQYSGLIKTGIGALSSYGAYKDQKKKNEMQQAAYQDYLAQTAAAGKEAQAAIDNLDVATEAEELKCVERVIRLLIKGNIKAAVNGERIKTEYLQYLKLLKQIENKN